MLPLLSGSECMMSNADLLGAGVTANESGLTSGDSTAKHLVQWRSDTARNAENRVLEKVGSIG